MKPVSPCAGIIVIDNTFQGNCKTILVCTDRDNYSFPKGKRHKGETTLDTAWRELEEETGLTKDNIQLVSSETLDELSDRGGLATRYYVGKLIEHNEKITFDPEELKKVEWIDIEEVYIPFPVFI